MYTFVGVPGAGSQFGGNLKIGLGFGYHRSSDDCCIPCETSSVEVRVSVDHFTLAYETAVEHAPEAILRVRQVCLYQDSEQHYVSIQLAVLSIREHEPTWRVNVYLTSKNSWLVEWLNRYSDIDVYFTRPALNGFNAKPFVIEACLERTQNEVIWFDSDMILTRPISRWLDEVHVENLVIAENPPSNWPEGSETRTRGWGFITGRRVTQTINSCFIRFNQNHRELLRAWSQSLSREDYVASQLVHWSERPAYFLGDQDALAALLGAEQFRHIGLTLLRNGVDIAQCYYADGYAWNHRLLYGIRRPPLIIHAQGEKPWIKQEKMPVYLDVCPYKLIAAKYTNELHERDWLQTQTITGRLLTQICRRHLSLSGLLPAIFTASRRYLSLLKHPFRNRINGR